VDEPKSELNIVHFSFFVAYINKIKAISDGIDIGIKIIGIIGLTP
jgi:hypothetical protein